MKLIIAGSRSIKDYSTVRHGVIESGFWKKYGKTLEIVCGMAQGVDLLGLEFAKKNSLIWYEFPADWDNLEVPGAVIRTNKYGKKYNAKAGHDRNISMGEFADGLLAIWDGKSKGTKQMLDWAVAHGLECFVYTVNKENT